MTTGELCKKLREDVGLSQRELAEAMGLSQTKISSAERGVLLNGHSKTIYTSNVVKKYKEYFGIDILNGTDPKIQEPVTYTDEELANFDYENAIGLDPDYTHGHRGGYSYTVNGNGCVTTNIKTSEEELMKKREEEDKNYISSLEAENANLKKMLEQTNQDLRECVATNKGLQDQIDSEKACADFYEQRMRELEKENEELITNLRAREDEYTKLHEDYWSLFADYESIKSATFDLLFDYYKNHTKKPE